MMTRFKDLDTHRTKNSMMQGSIRKTDRNSMIQSYDFDESRNKSKPSLAKESSIPSSMLISPQNNVFMSYTSMQSK